MRAPSWGSSAAVVLSITGLAGLLGGCATESQNTVATQSVQSRGTAYGGTVYALAIGQFDNRSPYMRGMFSDGVDRLGGQAKTILKTHLSQTGRFRLLDRDNLAAIEQESKLAGTASELSSAQVLVSGEVTEFGRRETGDRALFGILGYGRKQTAYAKISLNIVDVKTAQVVYSIQGAGEYHLGNREILGTGGTAGYDATLNGKVLDLAIRDAVNKLVAALERGEWSLARP